MPRHPRLMGLLWRWHRRLGVAAAFFALMLALTGIVLNHSSELGLDRQFVDWDWLSRSYGDNSSNLPAYQLGDNWLTRAANGKIYLDAQEIAPCNGSLLGAVADSAYLYAACSEELLIITPQGALLESISSSTGLPTPLQGIGLTDQGIAVRSADTWLVADIEQMVFDQRPPGGAIIQQFAAGKLPAAIRQALPAPTQWLSWERLLLDLHSGRVLGPAGVYLIDFMGLLIACLATSGIAMWWLHRRRRQG
jgi:hypothetical protein